MGKQKHSKLQMLQQNKVPARWSRNS